MEPERWQRIKALFETAHELAPAERPAFLDREAGGDAALRDEVAAMLAIDGATDSFLDVPALAGRASTLLRILPDPFEGARFVVSEFSGSGYECPQCDCVEGCS